MGGRLSCQGYLSPDRNCVVLKFRHCTTGTTVHSSYLRSVPPLSWEDETLGAEKGIAIPVVAPSRRTFAVIAVKDFEADDWSAAHLYSNWDSEYTIAPLRLVVKSKATSHLSRSTIYTLLGFFGTTWLYLRCKSNLTLIGNLFLRLLPFSAF